MATQTFWTARGISSPDIVTIISAVIVPATAPPGTLRTLTVVSSSSANQVLNAIIGTVPPGATLTPVGGQPPGTFVWTFTY